MLDHSEFYKSEMYKDGLHSWCKECRNKHHKEKCILLKQEAMIRFGSQCEHIDKNGIRCLKNVIDNLADLDLIHPNGDGDAHRDLISNGQTGCNFYSALKKLGWKIGKFDVEIRCRAHHTSLDRSGKRSNNYKDGKFNNPAWLRKRYWEDGRTLEEIAIECGVCEGTIRNRIKKFNISRRKRGRRLGWRKRP